MIKGPQTDWGPLGLSPELLFWLVLYSLSFSGCGYCFLRSRYMLITSLCLLCTVIFNSRVFQTLGFWIRGFRSWMVLFTGPNTVLDRTPCTHIHAAIQTQLPIHLNACFWETEERDMGRRKEMEHMQCTESTCCTVLYSIGFYIRCRFFYTWEQIYLFTPGWNVLKWAKVQQNAALIVMWSTGLLLRNQDGSFAHLLSLCDSNCTCSSPPTLFKL